MRFRIYRSLDRPSSFLGIKGKFMIIVGIVAGISGLLGIIIGKSIGNDLVGMGIFLGGSAVGVALTLMLQGRMSVRQFTRFLSSRNIPEFIRMKPRRLIGKVEIFDK